MAFFFGCYLVAKEPYFSYCGQPNIMNIANSIGSRVMEYVLALANEKPRDVKVIENLDLWKPPNIRWIKLNVDVTVRDHAPSPNLLKFSLV